MNQFEKRMGVFPSLSQPAHEAARTLLRENRDRVEVAGKPGFWVVPKGTVPDEQIFHEFECDGTWFVIVEQEDMV